MANRRILIDSTLLIEFLRKRNKEKTQLWKLKEHVTDLSISAVSVFELFAGATSTEKMIDVQTLLKWFNVIDFNEDSI